MVQITLRTRCGCEKTFMHNRDALGRTFVVPLRPPLQDPQTATAMSLFSRRDLRRMRMKTRAFRFVRFLEEPGQGVPHLLYEELA